MSTVQWTPAQRAAIETTGNVLVSAAAGTGKTAVLTSRCAHLVTTGAPPTDIDALLVLTFTEAAAAEMRARIAATLHKLQHEVADAALRRHLRRQLVRLDAAAISTIHAFCRQVLADHFTVLGLDPSFRILDEDEQQLIKSDVLWEVFENAWADEELAAVLRDLLYLRSAEQHIGSLPAQLPRFRDFLDNVTSRDAWLARARQLSDAAAPAATAVAHAQAAQIAAQLQRAKALFEMTAWLARQQTARQDGGRGDTSSWQQMMLQDMTPFVDRCLAALEAGALPETAELIRDFAKPRWPNKPKNMDSATADAVKQPAQEAFAAIERLKAYALINADYADTIAPLAAPQTQAMLRLIEDFDRRYRQVKSEQNVLDFADLEHFTLALLSRPEAAGSDIAARLQDRYRYVLVDEFQDINPVQKAILDCIRRENNFFAVGDIKQSIYGFRGAEPDIFGAALENAVRVVEPAAANTPQSPHPTRLIDLNINFRSRPGILAFVNRIFGRLMTQPVAGIDYDEHAALHAPEDAADAGTAEPPVEIHLLDAQPDDESDDAAEANSDDTHSSSPASDADDLTAMQLQAALIARRIREMIGAAPGHPPVSVRDPETGAPRPARYSDIAILMRSLTDRGRQLTEMLRLADIPVQSQTAAGYFQCTEITDCLSLLKVLDNPQRDVELAAVLRSEFFGFSDSDLAQIRLRSGQPRRSQSFHAALLACAADASDHLAQRVQAALQRLDEWRAVARRAGLPDLLWRIFRETDYLSFVTALPGGAQRRANLLRLHDRAVQFEGFAEQPQQLTLGRFVEFVEKLLDQGADWAPAEPDTAAADAVRIISVHRSKGLEFPIVFVAALEQQFNLRDLHQDCLADADFGLGLQVIEPQQRLRMPSMAHQVIAERLRGRALAEEMRILYVAMTRAREHLVLCAAAKLPKCQQGLAAAAGAGGVTVPEHLLARAQAPWWWVLYALADDDYTNACLGADASMADSPAAGSLFTWRVHQRNPILADAQRLRQEGRRTTTTVDLTSADQAGQPSEEQAATAAQALERLAWSYDFAAALALPAKLTASGQHAEIEEAAAMPALAATAHLFTAKAAGDEQADALQMGRAVHELMRALPLQPGLGLAHLQETAQTLVKEGILDAALQERLDLAGLADFFAHEVGQAALTQPGVLREWPFTAALSPGEAAALGLCAAPSADLDDTIILKGMVDMIVPWQGGVAVVDYKTDRVAAGAVAERAARYTAQVKLYSAAVERILDKPVTAALLYFIRPRIMHNVAD